MSNKWTKNAELPVGTRVYVSGPMTGLRKHNYPMFNRVAGKLRKLSYVVYNPAENFGGKLGIDRAEYMRVDLTHLLQCQAIVFLPGWERSKGAVLEHNIALELGLKRIEVDMVGCSDSLIEMIEMVMDQQEKEDMNVICSDYS